MAEARVSIVIDRPVAEVFAYMADYNKNPSWQSSVIRASMADPPGVGTRIEYTRKVMGREVESVSKMTEYVENQKIRIATEGSGAISYSGGYDFTDIGSDRTRVDYAGTITVSRRLLGMVGRLLAKGFQNSMETDLGNLKRLLERG